jgi:hypothetical protein
MAFESELLKCVSAGLDSSVPREWIYGKTDDNFTQVETAGYFDDAVYGENIPMKKWEWVRITTLDGFGIYIIRAIASPVTLEVLVKTTFS